MSTSGVAALYGVVTFAVLAVGGMMGLHLALGWPLLPTENRTQGMLLVGWYAVSGIFARHVGAHGAKGATLGAAWRAGAVDVGRGFVGLFTR